MEKFKYSNNEINDYINSLPRDKELYINDKFSIKISEGYIETSYEYFEHDVDAIKLYYKLEDNIIVEENLFDWIRGVGSEKKPTLLNGFEEVFTQLRNGVRDLSIPSDLNEKFDEDIAREKRNHERDLLNDELYKYDKNLPFSILISGGKTSYTIHFFDEEEVFNLMKILNSKNDSTSLELISKTNAYLEKYQPEILNSLKSKEDNMEKEEAKKYTSRKGKTPRTKNFKDFSEKEKLRYNDITNQLIQNFDDLIMFNTKRYFEFVRCQNQFNMANYSFRNKTWLWNQATIQDFIPYFATFKEWNKNDLSVKAGEHGMAILIPFKNKTTYFVKVNEAGDNDGILPETLSEEELKDRNMKLSEDGHLLKKIEVQEFFQKQCIFSISQTTATPDMIPDIYKTYNTEATSDENNHILEKLKKFLSKMNIEYIENKDLNSLLLNGQNSHYWNGKKQIQLKEELPTDAKIMVLSHEIGHELMKHLDNSDLKQYHLDHENKEIQAQLFSDMVLDYLHIDTQNLYSKDYIEGYLKLTSQTPFWRDEDSWRKLKASQLLANVEAVDPVVSLFKEAYEQDFEDISKIENRSILHIAKNKDEYGIAREKREVNNASKNEFKEVKQDEIKGMEME